MIPYGRQWIDDDDVAAVVAALRSDFLTTGPYVEAFEAAVASYVGTRYGVAVANGTAALHAAMFALDVGPGDEVIVPALTFTASANCVLYQGGTPVFADVNPLTLCLDPKHAEANCSARTKAIIAVDFTGQPCDYDALHDLCYRRGIALVGDGCHALGGEYHGKRVGSLADLTAFSFHPVKQITTGEGGLITTNNEYYAHRIRCFRNHGITTEYRQRETKNSWFYEMTDLGYNYRLTDIQAALGISQMKKLPTFLNRRRAVAAFYDTAFEYLDWVTPLTTAPKTIHARHLYVVKLAPDLDRQRVFTDLRAAGIGVNVHYIPVYMHPFYRHRFGIGLGLCYHAEQAYEHIISLPIHPGLTEDDVQQVIKATIIATAPSAASGSISESI
ncbi:UDP-4-amino-4, 6-dideoxy-N-acetyl-beta-L-altrosamine transaminase [Desulfovibrionales bacterium]